MKNWKLHKHSHTHTHTLQSYSSLSPLTALDLVWNDVLCHPGIFVNKYFHLQQNITIPYLHIVCTLETFFKEEKILLKLFLSLNPAVPAIHLYATVLSHFFKRCPQYFKNNIKISYCISETQLNKKRNSPVLPLESSGPSLDSSPAE